MIYILLCCWRIWTPRTSIKCSLLAFSIQVGDSRTASRRSGINCTLDGVGSSSGVSHSRINGVGRSRINGVGHWHSRINGVGRSRISRVGRVGCISRVSYTSGVDHCEVGGSGVVGSRIDAISRLSGVGSINWTWSKASIRLPSQISLKPTFFSSTATFQVTQHHPHPDQD